VSGLRARLLGPGPLPRGARRALGVFAALLVLYLAGLAWALSLRLPEGALDPRRIAAVRVLGRDGSLLRSVLSREDGGATWVPLAQIAPRLIEATLVGEDRRFFRHRGVDELALLRGLWLNAMRRRIVSGGSTLTMQLARLLRPARSSPRSLRAKLEEALLALKLERVLDKRTLLWLYLNRAPYGNQTFGAEAAAQRYFNKPAARLSLAEAALLSALPRSPSGYNPFRGRERLLQRQRALLGQLAAAGRITAEQQRLALAEPFAWEPGARPFLAPHLVGEVLRRPELARATQIRTTLDLALQERVEAALHATVERLRKRGVSNAAALVVENATGEVLAYVGSADFWSEADGGQNDGTLARRQAGSAIKPFTYALALERGKTPASLMQDLPVHFTTDKGDYAPRNYDDTFHGPVRLRVALGSSYNVPAVHAAEFVGVDGLLRRLQEVGLRSLDRPARYYGLGLTLGNGETTLQELVTAFSCLARGGMHLPLRLYREARTAEGQRLAPPPASPRRVFERRAAYLVSHILADPNARLPAFGRRTPLEVGFPASVKTGTSKDFRDNWTIGYTPEVTVGVWVGNFDGSSMHNVSGITGAGPLWAEVITAAARARRGSADSSEELERPDGLVERQICPLSGELVGPHCGGAVSELFAEGSEPREPCRFHRELTLDRRNGLLAGPGCDEQSALPASSGRSAMKGGFVERRVFTVYPPVYRAWALSYGIEPPPTSDSPLCPRREEQARVSIRFPASGDRYFIDPDLKRQYQKVPLEATVEGWVREVRWLVDGREVARAPYPYSALWPLQAGQHRVEAVLPDGRRSAAVTITVE